MRDAGGDQARVRPVRWDAGGSCGGWEFLTVVRPLVGGESALGERPPEEKIPACSPEVGG